MAARPRPGTTAARSAGAGDGKMTGGATARHLQRAARRAGLWSAAPRCRRQRHSHLGCFPEGPWSQCAPSADGGRGVSGTALSPSCPHRVVKCMWRPLLSRGRAGQLALLGSLGAGTHAQTAGSVSLHGDRLFFLCALGLQVAQPPSSPVTALEIPVPPQGPLDVSLLLRGTLALPGPGFPTAGPVPCTGLALRRPLIKV